MHRYIESRPPLRFFNSSRGVRNFPGGGQPPNPPTNTALVLHTRVPFLDTVYVIDHVLLIHTIATLRNNSINMKLLYVTVAFSALTLLVGSQEEHPTSKNER